MAVQNALGRFLGEGGRDFNSPPAIQDEEFVRVDRRGVFEHDVDGAAFGVHLLAVRFRFEWRSCRIHRFRVTSLEPVISIFSMVRY